MSTDRVVQVVKPDVKMIEALYNRAVALLFPSRYEGFGWPPIEAQACGCPVVGSDIPPLAEVLRPNGRAAGRSRTKPAWRRRFEDSRRPGISGNRLRQRGFENVRSRFQTSRMMDEYVSLYRELACQS